MDDLGLESREGQNAFLFSLHQIVQIGFGDHPKFCSFGNGILSRDKAAGA
jgi:hypothetical protein